MRLYSNTLLSWPKTLHLFQVARLYPGQWQNYYIYHIQNIKPLCITTHSPIEFLQENHQYYCYDKYDRNKKLENYDNIFEMASVYNKNSKMCEEDWIHIPKTDAISNILS